MIRFLSLFALLVPLALNAAQFDYRLALVRELSPNFEQSLKQHPPEEPIDVKLAQQQHEAYSEVVRDLVERCEVLAGDPQHPDCNFIEDTAIIVEDRAVIARMGAESRQGEEIAVKKALREIEGLQVFSLRAPASMDGGDVLYTGTHLFVGLSTRTNKAAVNQLKEIFSGELTVVAIPVTDNLHLKSLMSCIDENLIVVAEGEAGDKVVERIRDVSPAHDFLRVPDTISANVLRIGKHLLIQKGFPKSEEILRTYCTDHDLSVITLEMSELIKADGALTCGSLLL